MFYFVVLCLTIKQNIDAATRTGAENKSAQPHKTKKLHMKDTPKENIN